MPDPDLRFAVHLDGGLVTREVLDRLEAVPGVLVDVLDESGEAVFRAGGAATDYAGALKRALPDDLVSVVLWFES